MPLCSLAFFRTVLMLGLIASNICAMVFAFFARGFSISRMAMVPTTSMAVPRFANSFGERVVCNASLRFLRWMRFAKVVVVSVPGL